MKQDITGKVVTRAVDRVNSMRTRMNGVIPYGPLSGDMSPTETRKTLSGLDPTAKMEFIQRVGDDEWRKMMSDIYGG